MKTAVRKPHGIAIVLPMGGGNCMVNLISNAGVSLMLGWVALWLIAVDNKEPLARPITAGIDELDRVDSQISKRRRPLALAIDVEQKHLLVANARGHSVSVVNLQSGRVVGEWDIGGRPSALLHWIDQQFLVTDATNHQLVCIKWDGTDLTAVWRRDCIRFPSTLLIDRRAATCWIGGLWSRGVECIELGTAAEPAGILTAIADLPFAVGHLTKLDAAYLLALDAFGNQFAVIQSGTCQILRRGELPSRRSGGVATLPETSEIVVSQQLLNPLAHSVRNDVHWGLMVANDLRRIDVGRFLEDSVNFSDLPAIPLGGAGDAKADPGQIVIDHNGQALVALGGVNQVAIGDLTGDGFAFVDVGRRPLAIAIHHDTHTAYVANHLDDTISVIDVGAMKLSATIPLGNTPEISLVDRGEQLFFDATLSHDSWMSCHSCHVEGHTNGLLNDNLSDQSFGAPKTVMSLLGRADTAPFAWNGSVETLSDQVRSSIVNTMQSDSDPEEDMIAALTAYVESLPAPPPLDEARGNRLPEIVEAGKQLFVELNCHNCHSGERFTSEDLFDVGLSDELGNRQFNPPSLVGVSQRSALFHDSRARSLEEVFTEHRHQLPRDLTSQELEELISFLRSL